jgi:endoglucanase
MKNHFLIITLLSIVILNWNCSSNRIDVKNLKTSENIRLNQLGYFPKSVKKAVVVNSKSDEFRLIDSTGIIVFSGTLEDKGEWDLSKEMVKIADFSSFINCGTYKLYVEDLGVSYPFKIDSTIYAEVFKASIKAFYIQRASTAIEEKFAGKFNHPLAHPDMECLFHPSSGKTSGKMSSPKGWYDAGDYNKYIVNAGFTVSTMLTFYENYPRSVPDKSLNIPESGNGVSDLLDEIKYELDWAETMQDADGGVFFKLTSKSFCGFVKPQDDLSERYVVGKSTSSSLNFAAMFAQAGRVWKETDAALSDKYISKAKLAWKWAINNPAVVFRNPKDISTGAYSHGDFKADFYWAAAELFVTTGEAEFQDYLAANTVDFSFTPEENWRNYLKNLGYYALLLPDCKLPDPEKDAIRKAVIDEANRQCENLEKCPYRQPLSTFAWGSNSDILDLAIIFAQAYKISNDKKYLDAAIETTDYIFGKNAAGISFVTGFGSKAAMNPHFRLSATTRADEPIPGWVVGGPNKFMQDGASERNPGGVKYTSSAPAQAYMDVIGSYASNEIAINWNAALVYMTGFLEDAARVTK